MKRALLIAGGTVGGLGAVLAITPPQLSTTSSINIAGGSAIGTSGTSSSASASSSSSPVSTSTAGSTTKPVATKKATTNPTASKSATATTQPSASASASATASASASASASHSTTKTTAPVTSTVKDGTFTGPSVYVNYGNVQVMITVVNGRITDAVAVKAPSGKNDRYTNMAVPILKQQTLKAQSANIQGASGASYTSYGWFKSLQGALADAGF
jgi:uncharacterized protein with FMN-binding domain